MQEPSQAAILMSRNAWTWKFKRPLQHNKTSEGLLIVYFGKKMMSHENLQLKRKKKIIKFELQKNLARCICWKNSQNIHSVIIIHWIMQFLYLHFTSLVDGICHPLYNQGHVKIIPIFLKEVWSGKLHRCGFVGNVLYLSYCVFNLKNRKATACCLGGIHPWSLMISSTTVSSKYWV